MFSGHFKSYFDVTKWLYLILWVVYFFPINAIILFIKNAHKHKIYRMNQSQPNITSHVQSYRDGGITSSHVTFSHSFSITPTKLDARFRGSVKTQLAQGRRERHGLPLYL